MYNRNMSLKLKNVVIILKLIISFVLLRKYTISVVYIVSVMENYSQKCISFL